MAAASGDEILSAASKIEGHPDNAAAGALRRRHQLLRDADDGTIPRHEMALAGWMADHRRDAGG